MFKVKGRYVIAWWLLPLIYLPGLGFIYSFISSDAQWYWYDISYYLYFQLSWLLLLISLLIFNKVDWKKMVSKPDYSDLSPALKLTTFTFFFSLLSSYIIFLPLSYVVPEFVQFWFINIPDIIYGDENGYPWLPNLLNLISLVILAPIIEEIAFRGMLLHRWAEKWNLTVAILVSSLIFGLLHPDSVGAAAFGIAMCIIYLKTQTLIIPIICHALYNFICWIWAIVYEIQNGPNHRYTMDEFRNEWFLMSLSLLVVSAWVYKYVNSKSSVGALRLPLLDN